LTFRKANVRWVISGNGDKSLRYRFTPNSGHRLVRGLFKLLARRQAFKGGRAVRNEMERLTFRREDRHLRAAIDGRIVQRSDLQDHRWQTGPPRDHVRTAHRAEFPRYCVSLIGPRVGVRRAFRVGETLCWHEHEQIRRSTRDTLTRAAVALRS